MPKPPKTPQQKIKDMAQKEHEQEMKKMMAGQKGTKMKPTGRKM